MRSLSRLGLGAAVLFSLAACSITSEEAGADTPPSVHDVVNAPADQNICSTLDYGAQTPSSEYYRFFDSDAAAGTYITKLLATGQLASNSGADAKLREITSDPRLVRLVGEVFAGFKSVFPRETAFLDVAPRIAIIESDILNAFALGPGFAEEPGAPTDRSPYLFIVHTAILKKNATDTELRGLFAHELGHLLLRTFLPEIQQRVRSIYMVGKAGEDGVIGAVQEDDPAVSEHVEKILKIQLKEGGIGELGFPVIRDGQYVKVLDLLTSLAARTQVATAESKAACQRVADKKAALLTTQRGLLKNLKLGDLVPSTPTDEQREQLEGSSAALIDDIKTCTAPIDDRTTLAEITALINNLAHESIDVGHPDHAKLTALMTDIEREIDQEMPDASGVTRVLTAEARSRAEIMKLRHDPRFPIEKIRVFDYEEDADDASARVLSAIGDDATGVGQFLLSALSPEAQAACIADIQAGKPISYGQFIDTHPSICWRYYHVQQFEKALSVCQAPSPVASSTTTPKGNGRESVLDRIPHTEKSKGGYGVGQWEGTLTLPTAWRQRGL